MQGFWYLVVLGVFSDLALVWHLSMLSGELGDLNGFLGKAGYS